DVVHWLAGEVRQRTQRIVERLVAALDEPVSEHEQSVGGSEADGGFLVGGVRLGPEQHSLGEGQRARASAAHHDRGQVAGPGPAQGPVAGIVDPADRGPVDVVGEVVGPAVEPAKQGPWAGSGDGEAAQEVPQRDHAGDSLDSVPRDVTDGAEYFVRWEQHGVIPVAADQVLRASWAVPGGHVKPYRLNQLRGLRG